MKYPPVSETPIPKYAAPLHCVREEYNVINKDTILFKKKTYFSILLYSLVLFHLKV